MISIPSKTIREYRKFVEYSEEGCWSFKPEALKTLRGDKLKEIIEVLGADGTHVLFTAQSIYDVIDRIHDLEQRVRTLEKIK